MLSPMPPLRATLPLLAVALLAAACSSPPPVAEQKPKRKSFEESSPWTPAPSAGTGTTASTDERARAIQEKWEQVRQSGDEAERQRLANEALRDTRALADQPSGQ